MWVIFKFKDYAELIALMNLNNLSKDDVLSLGNEVIDGHIAHLYAVNTEIKSKSRGGKAKNAK